MKDVKSVLIFDSEIESPVVTIAIPTYKRGELLSEAIQSAIHQEGFQLPYDIMVVDNEPSRNDITEEIMVQYKNHPSVSYYKNSENLGMSGNWNHLYDLAKGKYVVMLHDDDLLLSYYLKIIFSLLEATNYKYELVYPSSILSKDRIFPATNLLPDIMKYRIIKREDYIVNQWGAPSGMLIKKSMFPLTGGFDDYFYPAQDQEFIYRSLKDLKGCVVCFPIVLYYVGVNESMKIETQIAALSKIKEFNHLIRKDKDNKLRLCAYISYRPQIYHQLNFFDNYVNKDKSFTNVIKKEIGFRDNKLLYKFSNYFVYFLNIILCKFRIYNFPITEKYNIE